MAQIAHAIAGSTNGISVTSSAIDTTGATLLVLIVVDVDGGATVSDSYGNTWTALTPYVTPTVQGAVRIHYAADPIVGAGHTFSANGGVPAIAVQAHSGVITSSPFDGENGAAQGNGVATTIATGTVTPTLDGALFITGYQSVSFAFGDVDDPFIPVDQIQIVGGQHYTVGSAYYEQDVQAALGATWAAAGAVTPACAAAVAAFKTRSITPVPLQPPPAPQTNCTPQSQTNTAVKGQAGCNDGGKGFVLEYTGDWGSVPVHPDPPEHERLTGKDRRTVEAWIEVNTVDYPSGDPVQLLRAMVPLADDPDYEGGSKTDGLLAVGDVEDALGNEQGGFEATTVDVQISGAHDNTIHTSADDQDFGGAELIVKLASDEARAAGTPGPLIMMRAIVQQLQFKSHKLLSLKALDQLFSDGGVYGPNTTFPHKTYGDLGRATPQMTEDVKALPIVPLYGEKTDNGAVTRATGVVNTKGLIPGVYIGKFIVSGLATPTATTGKTLAQVVAELQASVTAGTTDADWGAIIGHADAANLQALGTVPDTYDRLAAVIGYADLDALLAMGTTPAPVDEEWGILAFGYGPWYGFTEIEGSDLGGGIPENRHDRTQLDITARSGSDLLVPGHAPCPWTTFSLTNPDTGEVFHLAAIGVRGPLLDDHLNGVVNIAANGIGLMDADGLPIMGAYDAAFHAIENFMYLGKTAGPWATNATAPKYSDGVYKVNSASFARCQAYSATSLGGHGLRASWYPDTQKSKAQAIGDLMRDLEFRMGYDRHGQLHAFLLDETLDSSTWPRIVHETDIFGDVEITQGENRENIATGICDWDPDFSFFRGDRFTERNDVAIAKYRKGTSTGERPGDQTIENAVINENDHLRWLLRRRVTRLGSGMTMITVVGRRHWWDPEYDVGNGVLLNTLDGTGAAGYVDRPCIVLRRNFSFETQLVTLTLWDVRDVLIATAFEDGLSRVPYETDDEDEAFWETDDPDLAPLELT